MVFRGLKVAGNGSPRKLDWRLIVAKGAVVMGLGSVDSGRRGRVLGIGWGVVWSYHLLACRWGVMAVSGTGGRAIRTGWRRSWLRS